MNDMFHCTSRKVKVLLETINTELAYEGEYYIIKKIAKVFLHVAYVLHN